MHYTGSLRIDSHVVFSERHPPEHLRAILGRNRFDGAILVVERMPMAPLPPYILGIVVRAGGPLALDEYQKHAAFRGVCCSLEQGVPEGVEELAARGIPLRCQ